MTSNAPGNVGQFIAASNEAGQWRGQVVTWRGSGRRVEDIGQRRTGKAVRRQLEIAALLNREAECGSKLFDGAAVRPQLCATLEIANCASADPGALGELLLGQPCRPAINAEQVAE